MSEKSTLLTHEQIGWELARIAVMDRPFSMRFIAAPDSPDEGVMLYSCMGRVVESPFDIKWLSMDMDEFSERYLTPVAALWGTL